MRGARVIPPQFEFRRLKRTVSIVQVLADRGWLARMKARGASLVGPCPLHGGDNPNAFVVHRDKNVWHCFTGCSAGGDVVELARRIQGGSYRAAAVYLASLAGDSTDPGPLPEPLRPWPKPFRPFTTRLRLDPYAPFLTRKGISPQTARSFDTGAYYGRGMLAGCIAVRLFDPQGQPLGYAGRHLDPERATHGKWKLPSGLPRNALLYAYHRAAPHRHRGLVLVECPWGALRLHQLAIPAVALLGTHMSPQQQDLLREMPRVVLLMDGDQAGRRAAQVIRGRLPRSVVVDLPEGLDPDDLGDNELAKLRRHLI
jgi:DNA primase